LLQIVTLALMQTAKSLCGHLAVAGVRGFEVMAVVAGVVAVVTAAAAAAAAVVVLLLLLLLVAAVVAHEVQT